MIVSRGQHAGAAVAAFLDLRVGSSPGPRSTRHTATPFPLLPEVPDEP
jgi:hypothetical protein